MKTRNMRFHGMNFQGVSTFSCPSKAYASGSSMKFLIAAATLGLLLGCSSTQNTRDAQYRWEKPGATDNDWNQDRGQCMAQSFSATAGNPATATASIGSQAYGNLRLQQAMIFASCMQGKGWMRVQIR
jgi:hypothetical protein